ncbi:MAG TPA: hypothetical protein VFV39_08975 [Limnobacter sp.]|nr:hypothetical protein [Limnobacter sp.]
MRAFLVHPWLFALCLALALPAVQAIGHVHGIEHRDHLTHAEHGHHHNNPTHLCLLVDGLASAQSLVSLAPAIDRPAPVDAIRVHACQNNRPAANPPLLRTRVRDPPQHT